MFFIGFPKQNQNMDAQAKQIFYKKLGKRVRYIRKEKELSQEQLAELIGKSDDTISNIERGIYPPRMETVAELALALNVAPYEFFLIDETDIPKNKTQRSAINKLNTLLENEPKEIIEAVVQHAKINIYLKKQLTAR